MIIINFLCLETNHINRNDVLTTLYELKPADLRMLISPIRELESVYDVPHNLEEADGIRVFLSIPIGI